MQWDVFHLRAHGAFHFGQRGVGMEETTDYAPSDTVFSALCNTMRLAYGTAFLDDVLGMFRGVEDQGRRDPLFLHSGAYPYVMINDTPLRFYPAPVSFQQMSDEGLDDTGREHLSDRRKVRWLSESLFWDWANGHLNPAQVAYDTRRLPNAVLVYAAEEALLSDYKPFQQYKDELDRVWLWRTHDVPHVAVDRVTNAPNIFQVGRLNLVSDGGLWCAFWHRRPQEWPAEQTRTLLDYVGEVGLGGERSSGYGQFTVVNSHPLDSVNSPQQTPRFITLSHYRPLVDEIDVLGDGSAYDLLLRRGWMSSPDRGGLRRNPVRMLAAGSVLRAIPGQDLYGGLVDVTPQEFYDAGGHTVWRYAYALPIGTS